MTHPGALHIAHHAHNNRRHAGQVVYEPRIPVMRKSVYVVYEIRLTVNMYIRKPAYAGHPYMKSFRTEYVVSWCLIDLIGHGAGNQGPAKRCV